jgi:hypothetical protein
MVKYLVIALLVGAALGFVNYLDRKAKRVWRNFADENDFEFEDLDSYQHYVMDGTYRDESVRVEVTKPGGDKTLTTYSTDLPRSAPDDMLVRDETQFTQLKKWFGSEEIRIRRAYLDDAFMIQGDSPGEIREFLEQRAVAEALLDLTDSCESVLIEDGSLKVRHIGAADSTDLLESYLDALIRCATRLEDAETDGEDEAAPDDHHW